MSDRSRRSQDYIFCEANWDTVRDADVARLLDEQWSAMRQVAEIAREVVARGFTPADLTLVVAARRAVSLLGKTGFDDDPLFHKLRGFEDETSDVIIGPTRDKWASEYLERVDRRTASYLTEVGQSVIDNFAAIVNALPRFEAFFRDERTRMEREAKARGWEPPWQRES
jgi:hypothetical protein